MGEIVVPELDTPENHRRLGEIRAAELEAAMAALGVTEWENLGYRDSDMMGRPGNRDPRSFWQANLDEAIGRLVWIVRRYRPDVMTTYNEFGGYGHPDHIRTHLVAVGAFARAGDPAWYPEQLAPEHGGTGAPEADGGLAPWAPAKLYEQAIPASVRAALQERMEEIGERSFWSPPEDATPEQLAEFEAFAARMIVPDETITAWVDVRGAGPALGGDEGPRHADLRRQPVRPVRRRRLARLLVPGGVRPPRVPRAGPGAGDGPAGGSRGPLAWGVRLGLNPRGSSRREAGAAVRRPRAHLRAASAGCAARWSEWKVRGPTPASIDPPSGPDAPGSRG